MYKSISIGILTIVLAGYFVFAMKREVEILNFEKKTITKQIKNEKDNINLLKAEFCHLTSPSRLSKLSKQYLVLNNLTPDRMVRDPLKAQDQGIQNVSKEIAVIQSNNRNIKLARGTVNWRYKQSPLKAKYIKHASLNRAVVR